MSDRKSAESKVFAADNIESWPTGRLLSTAARLVEHAWYESLKRMGLTHHGLVALHHLSAGPLSQTELARVARTTAQEMSRTLERLERDGYVSRVRSPDDARRRVVTLTPAGDAIRQEAQHLEANMFPPAAETAGLRRGLLDVIAACPVSRW